MVLPLYRLLRQNVSDLDATDSPPRFLFVVWAPDESLASHIAHNLNNFRITGIGGNPPKSRSQAGQILIALLECSPYSKWKTSGPICLYSRTNKDQICIRIHRGKTTTKQCKCSERCRTSEHVLSSYRHDTVKSVTLEDSWEPHG